MTRIADTLPVKIALLNHASVLIEAGELALLTDPWYFGHAFGDGWGLKYVNDEALSRAAAATHLWISHFHEDHFHIPTLRALAALNPDMVLLANRSHNFDIGARARTLGFKNVISFDERMPMVLGGGVTVTRYPTTGIDNMLLIEGPGWTILNFNDCVIPRLSKRLLARKLGRIDVFMCNFNHAGKLLHRKKTDDARVKRALIDNFRRNYEPFRPRHVIPFASHHYYRAPESAGQNSSMLTVAELAGLDPMVVPLRVGDQATFAPEDGACRISAGRPAIPDAMTEIERSNGVTLEALSSARGTYARKMRSGFGPLAWLLPPLRIRLHDLDRTLVLSAGRHARDEGAPDIECHSAAALGWLTKPYGTDTFAVGAHFRIVSARKTRLVLHLAMGMLVENRLDAGSLLSMLISRAGLAFLRNRREEILGILLSGKIYADYHKE